jgi:CheY-like chemotaxis protein
MHHPGVRLHSVGAIGGTYDGFHVTPQSQPQQSPKSRSATVCRLGLAMTFDFGEVFTVAARRVVPLVRAKKLAISFDCDGANVAVEGRPDVFRAACHRMFLAVVGVLQTGFVAFTASAHAVDGRIRLRVNAGGVGDVDAEAVARAIDTDLDLQQMSVGPRLHAQGFWRPINGRVDLHLVPSDGVLLTLELDVGGTWETRAELSAHGARAWLINVDDVMGTAWLRRFARLGWAVSRFASCKAAADQLAEQREAARPSIVVVVESGNLPNDGTLALPNLLPRWTRLVYAVPAGSASLRDSHAVPGYEVHVFPFSPHQLDQFVVELEGGDVPSGHTRPAPLEASQMPRILLVDDSPVNLIVGQAMLEALNYTATVATDGIRAIEACKADYPPALVMMDVNMPEVNGIEATKYLRAAQRRGALAPFPILGFTAAWTEELRHRCLAAGMDECLPKPLELQTLAAELRRVLTMA